jgi:hypothetical protein
MADDTFAWVLDADAHWNRLRGNTRYLHREMMERTLAQATAVQ